jgi:hypothetical protein
VVAACTLSPSSRLSPELSPRERKGDLEVDRGVSADESTIYRTLMKPGFTFKRSAFTAEERVEDRIRTSKLKPR